MRTRVNFNEEVDRLDNGYYDEHIQTIHAAWTNGQTVQFEGSDGWGDAVPNHVRNIRFFPWRWRIKPERGVQ